MGLAKRPDDWRLLSWAAVFQSMLGNEPAARQNLEKVLELPDDTKYDDATLSKMPAQFGLPKMAIIPQLEECDVARSAFRRLQAIRQLQPSASSAAGKGAPNAGVPTPPPANRAANEAERLRQEMIKQQRSHANQPQSQLMNLRRTAIAGLPARTQQLAKIDSATMLIAMDAQKGGDRIRQKFLEERDDPQKVRYMVLALGATGTINDTIPAIARLQELLPDDPLPHIARLSATNSAKSLQTFSAEAKEVRLQSIQASYGWIAQHHPELRLQFASNYYSQLIAFGRTHEAAELLSDSLDSALRLSDISNMARMAVNLRDPALSRKIFVRVPELAAGLTDQASITMVQWLLTEPYLSVLQDDDVHLAVDAFERLMEMTKTKNVRSGTLPTNARTVVTTSAGQATRSTTTSPSIDFPCPTAELNVVRFNALQTLYNRLKSAGKVSLLAERLSSSAAADSSPNAASRLAEIYVLWWSGKRAEAIEMMEGQHKRMPGDPVVRLLLARARQANEQPMLAYQTLMPLRVSPGALGKEIDQLHTKIMVGLLSLDVPTLFEALRMELTGIGFEPRIGLFLGMPRHSVTTSPATSRTLSPRSSTLSIAPSRLAVAPASPQTQPTNATIVESNPLPDVTATIPSTPQSIATNPLNPWLPPPYRSRIMELLEFARQQGTLSELGQCARKCSDEYDENADLLALATLISLVEFGTPDPQLIARWVDRVERRREQAEQPETLLMTFICLERPELRTIGNDLAGAILRSANGNNLSQIQQAVLARRTWAHMEAIDPSEADRIFEQLVQSIQTVSRRSGLDPEAAKAYRLASFAPHLHPSLLPRLIETLAIRVTVNFDQIKQSEQISMPLSQAINAIPRDFPEDKIWQILTQLDALLFPFGPERGPALSLWKVSADRPATGIPGVPGGLAGSMISLAKSRGALSELRRRWDAHPAANEMDLLTLRAEAAFADGDLQATQDLTTRLAEAVSRSGSHLHIWTRSLRAGIDNERQNGK
jgi:hypothetical protein